MKERASFSLYFFKREFYKSEQTNFSKYYEFLIKIKINKLTYSKTNKNIKSF